MSRTVLGRLVEVTAVALARGFTVEAKPMDMGRGVFVRIRRDSDSGTVYINRAGELVSWRTGGRPAFEQVKATLEQLGAARG